MGNSHEKVKGESEGVGVLILAVICRANLDKVI